MGSLFLNSVLVARYCLGGDVGSTEVEKPGLHAGVLLARKTNRLQNLTADNFEYALAA